MYTIILSCNHQAAQNAKPCLHDRMDCPVCLQSSQVIGIQEHRRDSAYSRLVAAEFVQPDPASILDRLSRRPQ